MCSVASPVAEGSAVWTCFGWSGTGSVPSPGTGATATFVISEDSRITWNWQGSYFQRSLSVISTHGKPTPAVGNYAYYSHSPHTYSVVSPVDEEGLTWTCTGWSDSVSIPESGSGLTITFEIRADSTITWEWNSSITRCKLNFASNYGNPNIPMDERFCNYGDLVEENVPDIITGGNVN